jgi:hypothetical protein
MDSMIRDLHTTNSKLKDSLTHEKSVNKRYTEESAHRNLQQQEQENAALDADASESHADRMARLRHREHEATERVRQELIREESRRYAAAQPVYNANPVASSTVEDDLP